MRFYIVQKITFITLLVLSIINHSPAMEVEPPIPVVKTSHPNNLFLGCDNNKLIVFGSSRIFPKFSTNRLTIQFPDTEHHKPLTEFVSRPEIATKLFRERERDDYSIEIHMKYALEHNSEIKNTKESLYNNRHKLPYSLCWEAVNTATSQFIGILLIDQVSQFSGSWVAPTGDLHQFYAKDIRENTYVKINYALDPEYQNQGYEAEMSLKLIDLLFHHTNIKVILHQTFSGDLDSARIAHECGFLMKGQNSGEDFRILRKPVQEAVSNNNSNALGQPETLEQDQLEEIVFDLIHQSKIEITISDRSNCMESQDLNPGNEGMSYPHVSKILPKNKGELRRWCAQGFQYAGNDGFYWKQKKSCKGVLDSHIYHIDHELINTADPIQRDTVRNILTNALLEIDNFSLPTEGLALDPFEKLLYEVSEKLSQMPLGKNLVLYGTYETPKYKCDSILRAWAKELPTLYSQDENNTALEILRDTRKVIDKLKSETTSDDIERNLGDVSYRLFEILGNQVLGKDDLFQKFILFREVFQEATKNKDVLSLILQSCVNLTFRGPLEIFKNSSSLIRSYQYSTQYLAAGALRNPNGYFYKDNEPLDTGGHSSTEHYSFRLFCYGIHTGFLPLIQYVTQYHNNIWDRLKLADELQFVREEDLKEDRNENIEKNILNLMTYLIKKDYVDIFDCLTRCKEFKDFAFGPQLKIPLPKENSRLDTFDKFCCKAMIERSWEELKASASNSDLKDTLGNTPLHTLAQYGSQAMIERFLKEQDLVDLCLKPENILGENWANPLQIAKRMERPQVIVDLLAGVVEGV